MLYILVLFSYIIYLNTLYFSNVTYIRIIELTNIEYLTIHWNPNYQNEKC